MSASASSYVEPTASFQRSVGTWDSTSVTRLV